MTGLRCFLMLNATAAADVDLRQAVADLRAAGHELVVQALWEPGQACQFARQAAEQGDGAFDRIIAAGGDGTVNEMVNGIMAAEASPPVAIVPTGTANDFASAQGLTLGDPAAALRQALAWEPRPVDLGWTAGRWFLNVLSGGIGAEGTRETPGLLKKVLGGSAYTLHNAARLFQEDGTRLQLTIDGESFEDDVLMLVVANSRLAGGGHHVAPQADIQDGLLDVVWLPDLDQVAPTDLLADWWQASHSGPQETASFSAIRHQTCRSLSWRLPDGGDMPFNCDGEALRAPPDGARIQPQAIQLCLPAVGSH